MCAANPQDSCIFCAILRGEAPATMVYQDEHVAAFMDIRPVNPGHVLVIPRVHAPHLADLPPGIGGQLF
ncbi:MAG: HIT family protein, partial [Candidatus Hydrogenedentes bacterium]|nr:HIT family protein [Candidatus Hydrogenedentota bacterium]